MGVTYPNRAKGLVKKGRAKFVNDYTICLSTLCPPINMEDNHTMNLLYFNAREWKLDLSCRNAKGTRSFITDMDGGMSECYTIGDWENGHYSTIYTKQLLKLEKNQDYTFVFWLNGGENDRNSEECQFQVVYTDWNSEINMSADLSTQRMSKEEWDDRLIFKLNRGYIKPLKHCKGWELYALKFHTYDKEYTQLRFFAEAAYTTILPAADPENYKDIEDAEDLFKEYRPQRHNICFENGWPDNTWYGTKRIMIDHQLDENAKPIPGATKYNQQTYFQHGRGFGRHNSNQFSSGSMNIDMPSIEEMNIDIPSMEEMKVDIPSMEEMNLNFTPKGPAQNVNLEPLRASLEKLSDIFPQLQRFKDMKESEIDEKDDDDEDDDDDEAAADTLDEMQDALDNIEEGMDMLKESLDTLQDAIQNLNK